MLLAMALLVAVKVWLVWGQRIGALPIAGYDDGLYLRLAQHLVDGNWLGPYDLTTLLKAPGYSIWIAANSFTGLPLHISQHLIYAGACALFIRAIKPVTPSARLRLAVFAVLLFQPMSYSTSTLRYVRDSLYTTQVLCVLGCTVALMLRTDASPRVLAGWSVALGLAGGLMWVTRDEGIVMAPALALAAILMAVSLWRRRPQDWRRRVAALGVAVPVGASIVLAVSLINLGVYGFFGISEFSAQPFNAAVGALARVEPAEHIRWVIVTTETRERIYPHSAAFRELRESLESLVPLWGVAGPMMYDGDQKVAGDEIATGTFLGTICHEYVDWDPVAMHREIMTGWFAIALREAVVRAGHGATPSDGMAFYTRLAGEVNDACDAGLLRCGPARANLAPPWRWENLGLTLRRACRGAARLLTLSDMHQIPSVGTDEEQARIVALTNDRLMPNSPVETLVSNQGAAAPDDLSDLDRWKAARLADIQRAYATVTPIVAAAAAVAFVFLLARWRAWHTTPLLGPAMVVLVAAGARLGLLAYMDATAFPFAMNQLYMLPIYPLMFAVIMLVLIEAGRSIRRWRLTGTV